MNFKTILIPLGPFLFKYALVMGKLFKEGFPKKEQNILNGIEEPFVAVYIRFGLA